MFLSNSPHNLHGCCQQTQRGKDYAFISPSYEAFFLSGLWSIYSQRCDNASISHQFEKLR